MVEAVAKTNHRGWKPLLQTVSTVFFNYRLPRLTEPALNSFVSIYKSYLIFSKGVLLLIYLGAVAKTIYGSPRVVVGEIGMTSYSSVKIRTNLRLLGYNL